ncbi:MAG: MASE3 domain-containing protein [Desulfovibrionaceae bacterium]
MAALVSFAAILALMLLGAYNLALAHSLVEGYSILAGCIIFSISWNSRWRTGNHFLLVLGSGYLCYALFDFLHLLVFAGMRILPDQPPELLHHLDALGDASRAIAFLAAIPFLTRRASVPLVLFGWIAIASGLLWVLFSGILPPGSGQDESTGLYGHVETVLNFLLLFSAMALLHLRRAHLPATPYSLLQFSLAATLAQLSLLLPVWHGGDMSTLASACLEAVSCLLVYTAVFECGVRLPQQSLYSEIERGRRLLSEAEQRYRSITDGAPVGIFRSTPDNTYLYANPRLAEIYGYGSPGELVRGTADIAKQIFADPQEFGHLREMLEREQTVSGFEALIRRPDGSTIWTTRDMRVCRDLSGNILYYDGFVSDISDRKRLESLQSDMERILRHDMKAPLISLTSGMAMIRALCRPDHRGEVLLGEMERSAMQMLSLIDLSVRLNKMEAGEYEIDLTPVDLMELTRRIRDEHRMLIIGKNLTMEVTLDGRPDGDGNLHVLAETALCHSLLSNLVRNSLEAAPEGSTVYVELASSPEPSLVVDNPGEVPVEFRQRFFDKYATQGKPDGTGLGTYSARLIAETHGWTIAMESGDGRTRVCVAFFREMTQQGPAAH